MTSVLSLFTGIGGLDLGLQRAGMTIAGQVEIDPWCRTILAKHWPEVPRHDDVRTCADWWGPVADAESVGRREGRQGRPAGNGAHWEGHPSPRLAKGHAPGRPRVDLVCGGFPCQPVSLAGKGLAQADSRWLWPATCDVIRHLRPRWVLLENVPGLLGRGMGDVLGDLAALGYDAEWDCIPAVAVGAPHIRNRVWIVAYPQRRELRQQPGRGDGQSRPRAPFTGDDGQARALAHTAGIRQLDTDDHQREHAPPRRAERAAEDHRRFAGEAGSEPGVLAHTVSSRLHPRPRVGTTWPAPQRSSWWAAEPDVGRVAHGIPRRVDRLRGLGNAVVPQVAEHIGRLILAAMNEAA